MKKSIWIFLLAVLLPSVVLGWLALRSAEEQQIILEKRTAELFQKETENAAGAVRALIDGERRAFNERVRRVLANNDPQAAARDFNATLAAVWSRKAVGFALGKEGRLISPSAQAAQKNAEAQKFLLENSAFLCSTMPATVYWVSGDDLNRPDALRRKFAGEAQIGLKIPAEEQQQRITLAGDVSKGGAVSLMPNGNKEAPAKDLEKAKGVPAPAPPGVAVFEGTLTRAPLPGAAPLDSVQAPVTAAAAPAPLPVAPAAPAPPAPEATERFLSEKAPAPAAAPAAPAAPAPEATKRFPPAMALTPASAPAAPAMPATPAGAVADRSQLRVDSSLSAKAASARAARALPKVDKATAPAVTKTPSTGKATANGGMRQDAGELKDADLSAKAAVAAKAADAQEPAPTPEARQPMLPRKKQTEANLTIDATTRDLRLAQDQSGPQTSVRNVAPQRLADRDENAVLSQITPSTADFRTLTAGANEGVITRFVQDQLDVLFWLRPAQDPDMIFGCLIEAGDFSDLWPAALPAPDSGSYRERFAGRGASEFTLALLDDKARPVATQPPGETGRDWKRPFVASEIGEALPHWEAALYLQRPEQLRESARSVRRTLTFLIAAALGVIACGGWLVVADARRQLALAQQKSDFVSNVSHELKTPLTSIRMFAELMQSGRPGTESKHPQYLRIIMVEAERLTRLINNVLDFARIERRQKRFDKKPLDLHEVVGRIWEGHELHLREAGFSARWEGAPGPYPVVGDEDALAQILVNLLSNAEKYSRERQEVELHSYIDGGKVCVSVLDRGAGVPAGEERKIFEAFYRAHDSLSNGIQGSGLGLTLAQRLAREHGGEILYQAREGGGSNFTLRLSLAPPPPPPMASL
jgi:signal transduction histidine kinase